VGATRLVPQDKAFAVRPAVPDEIRHPPDRVGEGLRAIMSEDGRETAHRIKGLPAMT
jgi:hypothetical protein